MFCCHPGSHCFSIHFITAGNQLSACAIQPPRLQGAVHPTKVLILHTLLLHTLRWLLVAASKQIQTRRSSRSQLNKESGFLLFWLLASQLASKTTDILQIFHHRLKTHAPSNRNYSLLFLNVAVKRFCMTKLTTLHDSCDFFLSCVYTGCT